MAIAVAILAPSSASAATITVTSTVDEYGTANPACSLRDAIDSMNDFQNHGGCVAEIDPDDYGVNNKIVLTSGQVYTRSVTGAGEDNDATGDLDIFADLIITTSDSGLATVEGDFTVPGDRVFHTASSNVTLAGLEISNGKTGTALDPSASGAGIYNEGTLTVLDSAIRGNYSGDFGGGITNRGDLTVVNTTFSSNGAGQAGGAIDNLTGLGGSAKILNSTISQNQGDMVGGGGIEDFSNGASGLTLANSIVAGNTRADDVTPADCFQTGSGPAAFVSKGYNLIGTTSDCAFTSAVGDKRNVAARLGTRNDLLAFPLLASSPAVNAGNPAALGSSTYACPVADVAGNFRSAGGRCDIGALESPFLPPTPKPVMKKCGKKKKLKKGKCVKRKKKKRKHKK